MAEKVGGKATKVTTGKTRVAKGSGAHPPVKPQATIAPSVPPAPGHNSGNDQASMDAKLKQARQSQLLSARQKHREVDMQLDVLREQARELNGRRKIIRSSIETAGYSLKEYDRAEEDAGSTRIDLAAKEAMRAELRDTFGMPASAPKQADLFGGKETPELARGALYWEGEGYMAGVMAGPKMMEAPSTCPPEHRADYFRGVDQGQKRNGDAFIEANAITAAAEQRRQEEIDAKKNPPPADDAADPIFNPDAEDKTPQQLREEEAKARASLEAMGSGKPDDTFEEASEEQLQAQAGRRARGEEDTPAEEVVEEDEAAVDGDEDEPFA
jgi:hypothetical protein